jgi:hypothetical protein
VRNRVSRVLQSIPQTENAAEDYQMATTSAPDALNAFVRVLLAKIPAKPAPAPYQLQNDTGGEAADRIPQILNVNPQGVGFLVSAQAIPCSRQEPRQ